MADRYLLESGAPDGYQLEDASGVLLLETADNPPFSSRHDNLATIQRSWSQRQFGRPVASSGDAPPEVPASTYFGSTALRTVVLPTILLAWQIGAAQAMPSRAPLTPQVAPAVQADQPSRVPRPDTLATIDAAWRILPTAPQAPRRLVQPFVAAPADNPPGGSRAWLPIVARQWDVSAPPAPIWKAVVVTEPPAVDNPPPGGQKAHLQIIQRAWPQRDYGRPLTSAGDAAPVPPVVDNPPVGRKTHLLEILRVWHTPTVRPLWGFILLSEPVPGDDPPFGVRPWLSTVLRSWQPGPPQPQAARVVLTASFVPPPVNDPPFGVRPWLSTVLRAWQPGPPTPQAARVVFTPSFIPPAVNDPPFGQRPWLTTALAAWQPGAPKPWIPEYLIQPFVAPAADNPPFAVRSWLGTILGAWQAGPPSPQARRVTVTEGFTPPTVDQPPVVGVRGALATILGLWQPGPPRPQAHIVVVTPSETPAAPPVIGARTPLAVLIAWQPGPPMPWRPRWLPQAFIPPPVNDPPFGMRGHDGLLGRRDWWAPPIVRHRYNSVVQDGGVPAVGGYLFIEIRTARDFVAALRDRSVIVAHRGKLFIAERQGEGA